MTGVAGMKALAAVGAAALAVGARSAAASVSGSVDSYSIDDPEYGSCRLKGVTSSSDNAKYYASVSGDDTTLNQACARCIEVTRDDDDSLSVTAYVLDVCDGCSSGTVQLSSDALSELSLNSSTASSATVSWDFVTCPSSLLSGDVKACLMEGASSTYVPLQFYNSQKVITAVTIDGVNATSTDDTFLWYANPGSDSTVWYKSIDVTMASSDGENKSTTFEFTSTSGCATSDVQFSVASTADGVDGNTSGGSSSSSSSAGLIGGIVAAVVVVLLIIGSVIVYRRRRRASQNGDSPDDAEAGNLSPKKRTAAGTAANEEQSGHDKSRSVQEPQSPTVEYVESHTPASALNQPTDLDRDIDAEMAAAASAGAVAAAPATAFSQDSTSTTSSQRGVRPSSHLSFGTESPASPAASHTSSAISSNRSAPRSLSAEPTFRYSSRDMYGSSAVPNPQKQSYAQKPAPTLAAPVIPASMTTNLRYDDEDDRGSFNVDDMRDTEEMKSGEPGESTFDERSSRPFGSQAYYGAPETYGDSVVTSPQSYVRATTLRRNTGSVRKPTPSMLSSRSSSRLNNNSSMFGDTPQADPYAAPPRLADPTPSYAAPQSGPFAESGAAFAPGDSYGSQRNLGSSGGYSRDSLNILGYPYSKPKRSQRHHNMNG